MYVYIFHTQYHGCWWSGDLVLTVKSGFYTRRANNFRPRQNGRHLSDSTNDGPGYWRKYVSLDLDTLGLESHVN